MTKPIYNYKHVNRLKGAPVRGDSVEDVVTLELEVCVTVAYNFRYWWILEMDREKEERLDEKQRVRLEVGRGWMLLLRQLMVILL